MFRRRNRAADVPPTEHPGEPPATPVDTLPTPPMSALPVDELGWGDRAGTWEDDPDFARYAREAAREMATAAAVGAATWTPPPEPEATTSWLRPLPPEPAGQPGATSRPASPFGPVSDPFDTVPGHAESPPDDGVDDVEAEPGEGAPEDDPRPGAEDCPDDTTTADHDEQEPVVAEAPAPPDQSDAAEENAGLEAETLPVHLDRPQLRPDLQRLKLAAQDALVERMGARLYDRTLLDDQLENLVSTELNSFLAQQEAELSDEDQLLLTEEVINDVLRHGPIEPYLQDDSVSEIMVNGLNSIYVERNGRLHETTSNFLTEAHLRQIIERIVSKVGRRIDESSPMVDARLPDGSRVNAVVPPLAVDGPSLTIRKFAKDALGVDDLIRFGTLTPPAVELLAACVQGRLNILVSGGTGTGKTTLLNVLSSFIPDNERIVSIEDAVELQLHQRHVVRLESRPANVEGKGQITIRDLVRNSLRMRPDRVIVGECRGGEALDMLQAMNTGHDGSLSTLHANGPRDALSRLETLCLMAGMDLPIRAIREQIGSAVHLVVHIARLRDGSRRVTHITEVVGLEGEIITLSDVFTFDFDAGFDEEGHYIGTLQPTGLVPGIVRKLEDHGVRVATDLFDTGEDW